MGTKNMPNIEAMLHALGREIAAQRVRRGLTQADLSHEAGITTRQLGKIERGERGQLEEVWKVADALGLDFSRLVNDAEDEARRAG